MNFTYKTLIKIMGLLLGITGLAMIPSLLCAVYFNEGSTEPGFLISALASIILGFTIYKVMPSSRRKLKTRDGYLIVIICWLGCSLFGAIPYFLSGQVPSFIDAFFEAIAGYTTTGATVISDLRLSHSLYLWKATTHWLGGMGILVFIISILPSLGIAGQRLAAAETPGAGLTQMAPRIHDLAMFLYFIYLSFTLVEFLLLWLGSEMSAFEALVNSLGSISTSGLFLHPQGIAYYDSLFVEMVISIFTLLASLNFILYINIIKGNMEQLKKNMEIRIFFAIVVLATVLISGSLWLTGTYDTLGESARNAFFQVSSFMSTSGFSLTDYNQWPAFTHAILFTLLFIGGCAASTSGGIKVLRIVVVFKLISRGFYKRLHPRAVSAIRVGDNIMSAPMVAAITTFVFLYLFTFLTCALVLSLEGLSLETTLTASASLMSTTGSGLGDIAGGNFSVFSPPLRLFMCFIMVIGRLELFTVFLMFFPSFWNPNKFTTN